MTRRRATRLSKDNLVKLAVAVIGAIATIVVGYWQFVWKPSQQQPPPASIEYVGHVVDYSSGKAINNAKVTLESQGPPIVVYTDSEGVYRFTISDSSNRIAGRIRVEANGYENYDRNITLQVGNLQIEDIRVNPLQGPTPSSTILTPFTTPSLAIQTPQTTPSSAILTPLTTSSVTLNAKSTCTVEIDPSLSLSQSIKDALGCPAGPASKPSEKDIALVWQPFKNDQTMIWRRYPKPKIYVLYNDNIERHWMEVDDKWNKDMDLVCTPNCSAVCCNACTGAHHIVSGFANVWCNDNLFQDSLSQPVDKQRSIAGIVQDLSSGGHIIRIDSDKTYVLWPDSRWEVLR